MKIELDAFKRGEAIASLQRYFDENLPEPIGDLPAGLLLNFILEEIGPAIYNRGVRDARERLQMRMEDMEAELFAEEFQYWSIKSGVKRGRR
ncbi:MAG: DUF2164 domain-containing protein [Acidobacteria bacterium]|nr:DUF2164 domain-containing protein [Acidobacteriota bacterium]